MTVLTPQPVKPHFRLSTGDVFCGPLDGITLVVDNVCLVCGGIDTPFDLGTIFTEMRGTP